MRPLLLDHIHDTHRRIYTDGRDWPQDIEPSFVGYSIGKWRDENGDGHIAAIHVLQPTMQIRQGARSRKP